MNRFIIIFIFLSFSSNCFSQNVNFKLIKEYEDTLKIIANNIMFEEKMSDRNNANNGFIKILKEVLSYEKSFKYSFDSLTTISILQAEDQSFKLFNWILKSDNGSFKYFALIQYKNKKKGKYEIIELIDNSENIRNPNDLNLDSKSWYGCLYYKIIYIKKSGRKFYTLLGWDGNDGKSTKKIIDILIFGGKNKAKFGLPIFKLKDRKTQKRYILESDSKTTFSLNYNEKNKSIYFNNLIPIKKELKGMEEYYIPEGSFNSFEYLNGKWIFKEDIDAKGNGNSLKNKKPKLGLINR